MIFIVDWEMVVGNMLRLPKTGQYIVNTNYPDGPEGCYTSDLRASDLLDLLTHFLVIRSTLGRMEKKNRLTHFCWSVVSFWPRFVCKIGHATYFLCVQNGLIDYAIYFYCYLFFPFFLLWIRWPWKESTDLIDHLTQFWVNWLKFVEKEFFFIWSSFNNQDMVDTN